MALRNKIASGLANTTNLALAVTAAAVVYWLALDRAPPITVDSYVLTTTDVEPGGVIEIRTQITRHRSCPASITRYLKDSRDIVFVIPPAARQITMNGHDEITIRIPAPAGAVPGPAVLWSEAQYRCNPLQALWPIYARSPEVSLMIVPKAAP